jgi:3-oxoacyl-[acyl-carrier protein] reductase
MIGFTGGAREQRSDFGMNRLAGRRIIITGASGGFGAALAEAFRAEGAQLLLVARREAELYALRKKLGDDRVEILVGDITDTSVSERIFQGKWAKSDVLVNNAAVQGPIGSSWQVDWTDWRHCLEVNLLAAIALCHGCIPGMIRHGGGKIINLSGGGATASRPCFTAYATAKAGLVRFSECLAEEVAHVGIDVNCVAPGAMTTPMLDEVIRSGPAIAGEKEYHAALRARETGGETLAKAVQLCVFLASRESDGISGKLISAVWDPWTEFPEHVTDLQNSDIYTLRRIVPKDRGQDWDP